MKKKGFTLIELLAVIVILAIIALIVTPIIGNIIESAREASSRSSAQGYIDAVKNRISLSILDHASLNGTKTVSELESEVEYKGRRIDRGVITVENDELKEAKLCVNNYSFRYHNNIITKSDINYCVDESNIEITILGNTTTELLKNQYSYDVDLSGTDITSATNMVCNNNAVPSINENTLHIENIYGDTKCRIESSIVDTFTNLDDTTNNVVMIADETLNDAGLNIPANNEVVFNINGKTLKTVNTADLNENDNSWAKKYTLFDVYGTLTINGEGNLESNVKSCTIYAENDSNVTINNGNYNGRNLVQNNGGNVIINGGTFTAKGYTIVYNNADNALTTINNGNFIQTSSASAIGPNKGNIVINNGNFDCEVQCLILSSTSTATMLVRGGTFISHSSNVFANSSSSTISIDQTTTPIYISTLINAWKPAILNYGAGTLNITANQANACTANSSDTTSGLCVYAEGDKATSGNTGNAALQNSTTGIVNIDGGTYYGWYQCINNHNSGTVSIKNASVSSEYSAIYNNSANSKGIINIENTISHSVNSRAVTNQNYGNVSINGGIYTSENSDAIANNTTDSLTIANAKVYAVNSGSSSVQWRHGIVNFNAGTLNINDNVYVENKANNDGTNRGIFQDGSGTVNINGGEAVFDDNGNYISGIYVKTSTGYAAYNAGSGNYIINGGTYLSDNYTAIGNSSTATLSITNAKIYAVNNGSTSYTWRHGIVNFGTGTLNINDNVYVENKVNNDYSNTGIINDGGGTINITGNKATFDNNGNYVSGIYVLTASGQGIRNKGTLNMNGVTINSYDNAITNVSLAASISNIKNAEINSRRATLRNEIAGATINVCSSRINNNAYDISNNIAATVNYASDVIFSDGTNNPNIYNPSGAGTVTSGYTCQ